jgi:glycosyltransferase involved in cell wall biosynthesis
MTSKNSLSIVIPVFGGGSSLPELVRRLESVLAGLGAPGEIVLVNDGGGDGSWSRIEALARERPSVVGIDLTRNFGQHNALLCGVRAARFDVIVTMDDDLQHPPEEIPAMLEKLSEGTDVVYGVPEREQHGLWRDTASRVTKWVLQNAMGAETARRVSSFRAFRTGLREAFSNYDSPYVCLDVLLTWATSRFAAVTVRHEPRAAGGSQYTFRKLCLHALNLLTGFSVLPLRAASLAGFTFMFLGVALLVYVLARYFLQGNPVPGFPFLASAVALFAGVQLFALGVLGEYMARLYFRMMGHPAYAVRHRTGHSGKRPGPRENS